MRGESRLRAPITSASQCQAANAGSVQVNCRTWPPPQNSTSKYALRSMPAGTSA